MSNRKCFSDTSIYLPVLHVEPSQFYSIRNSKHQTITDMNRLIRNPKRTTFRHEALYTTVYITLVQGRDIILKDRDNWHPRDEHTTPTNKRTHQQTQFNWTIEHKQIMIRVISTNLNIIHCLHDFVNVCNTYMYIYIYIYSGVFV